jgi:hypothetical protein
MLFVCAGKGFGTKSGGSSARDACRLQRSVGGAWEQRTHSMEGVAPGPVVFVFVAEESSVSCMRVSLTDQLACMQTSSVTHALQQREETLRKGGSRQPHQGRRPLLSAITPPADTGEHVRLPSAHGAFARMSSRPPPTVRVFVRRQRVEEDESARPSPEGSGGRPSEASAAECGPTGSESKVASFGSQSTAQRSGVLPRPRALRKFHALALPPAFPAAAAESPGFLPEIFSSESQSSTPPCANEAEVRPKSI